MKQLHVTIDGKKGLVINLDESDVIHIHYQGNAARFLKQGDPETNIAFSGMRWEGNDIFHFDWGGLELQLNDVLTLRIVEGSDIPTPRQEKKYVEPEKTCSFCQRPASQLKRLIQGNMFASICDECVDECQQLISASSTS